MPNRYSLFRGVEGMEEAELKVNFLISEFYDKYEQIKVEHPTVGLGDTATDEKVVAVLYGLIHFGTWEDA